MVFLKIPSGGLLFLRIYLAKNVLLSFYEYWIPLPVDMSSKQRSKLFFGSSNHNLLDSLMGCLKFNSWLWGETYEEIDPNLETRGESAHILLFVSSFLLAHIDKTMDYRSRLRAPKNLLPRAQIEAVAASIKGALDEDPAALDPWCRDSDLPMLRFFQRVGSNTGGELGCIAASPHRPREVAPVVLDLVQVDRARNNFKGRCIGIPVDAD